MALCGAINLVRVGSWSTKFVVEHNLGSVGSTHLMSTTNYKRLEVLLMAMFKIQTKNLTQAQQVFVAYHMPKELRFTNHVQERMMQRQFKLSLDEFAQYFTMKNVTELQFESNKVKFLVSVAVNKASTLCFVVALDGAILTTYLNRPNREHLYKAPLYRESVKNTLLEKSLAI